MSENTELKEFDIPFSLYPLYNQNVTKYISIFLISNT